MKIITSGILTILLFAPATHSVELQPTPVQTGFVETLQNDNRRSWLAAADDTWTDDNTANQTQPSSSKSSGSKSVVKAAALSALVPGLGQAYNGRAVKSRIFFASEALTWVAFGAFKVYGNWKEDDLIAFGNQHANAQLDGKSDEFLDWVGFYEDINDFNNAGRVGDPDREYLPDTPENHWHWSSPDDQQVFRSLKNSAREADRRADFVLYFAAVNRVISVIDALIDARRINQSEGEGWEIGGMRYDLDVHPFSTTRQVSLTVYPGF